MNLQFKIYNLEFIFMYDFIFIIIVRCDRDIVLPVYESH